MRLLLDTHVFLWFISGDGRLRQDWKDQVCDAGNEVYLSVGSLWEVIIKYSLGRLSLPESPDRYIPAQRIRHQIGSLPIDEASVGHLAALPPVHRDPFDRIIVCQAIEHEMTIVTVDAIFREYPAPILERA